MKHRLRVAERYLVAEARLALIVVDRPFDLGLHLGELAIGLQAPPLDSGNGVVANHVIGIGPRCHRRGLLMRS